MKCYYYLYDFSFFGRMPIIDKFKDMGTVVMGKIESGTVREGDTLIVMPNKVPSQIHIFKLP